MARATFWILIAAMALGTGCGSSDADDPATLGAGDRNTGSQTDTPQDQTATPQDPNAGGDDFAVDAGAAPPSAGDQAAEAPVSPPPDVVTPTEPEPVETNPFVRTEDDPFSTFAADVDSASYDIFRRGMADGALPTPAEVRVEEFINYFEYDYPTPALDAEEPFSVQLAAAAHPLGNSTKLLRVGIQGAAPETHAPTNMVYLVDVSGSMSASNKLPYVQLVIRESLDVLRAEDTVSIVTYAGSTRVRLEPTAVSNRQAILDVVNGLEAGGSTAGASGINLAYEQAEAGFIQEGINHVLLMTDGDFNVGISDSDQLVALIEEKRQGGVTLTALGFGSRNNDAMMERVSNAGNGIYSVIFSEDQAVRYTHKQLLSSMIHIARDVKLQVEFNPNYVHAYRLLGYENRAVADVDFRDDSVDGGEMGAGHRVTAIYELALTEEDLPSGDNIPEVSAGEMSDLTPEVLTEELVRVKIRYEQPGSAIDSAAREVVSTMSPTAIKGDVAEADDDTQWALAVATFAEILRGSPYVDASKVADLGDILTPQATRDVDRDELVTLYNQAVPMLSAP